MTWTTQCPSYQFQLGRSGTAWRPRDSTQVAARANNLRTWDQILSAWLLSRARLAVYALELAAERVGREWWGPQPAPAPPPEPDPGRRLPAVPATTPSAVVELARHNCCPRSQADLIWTDHRARCSQCLRPYPKRGSFWEFSLSDGNGRDRAPPGPGSGLSSPASRGGPRLLPAPPSVVGNHLPFGPGRSTEGQCPSARRDHDTPPRGPDRGPPQLCRTRSGTDGH